jgi:hemerythrin superfamily protein
MPAAAKSASASKSTAKGGADAIALLKEDHREVEELFSKFEATGGQKTKKRLAEKICLMLKVHTQIEEEIFYPRSREEEVEGDLIDEAVVEHAAAKKLIAEIEAMEPGQDLYDAKVKVLQEMVEHHVEEEEKELFPEAKKAGMDMQAVGARLAQRKKELLKQMKAESQAQQALQG